MSTISAGLALGTKLQILLNQKTKYIAIDQGVDSTETGRTTVTPMDPDLLESAFIVKCDNRLLRIATAEGANGTLQQRTPQYIDDDYVASYYFVQGQVGAAIRPSPQEPNAGEFRKRNDLAPGSTDSEKIGLANQEEIFQGSLGRTLQIAPTVRSELATSNSLFEELGETDATDIAYRGAKIDSHHKINTTITVQGLTTGYSIDIPIKIIKGITFAA